MTGFDKRTRDVVIERAQGHCEICGVHRPEQLHHRRPRGKGGSRRPDTNLPSNALAICAPCHGDAEYNRALALDRGWLVRQTFTPATVPVQRHGGTWVLLLDDGTVFTPPHGSGRCERCGFHTKTQGHRQGCQLTGQAVA